MPARWRWRRGDAASGWILGIEAVFIGMFLATAIVFVATHDPSPSQSTASLRAVLQQQLEDLLNSFEDMADEEYGKRLQGYVIQGLNGETREFRSMLKRSLGEEVEVSAKLRTQFGERILFEDRQPTGEKVGWSKLFSVTQDTALIVPEVEAVDGLTMGLGFQAMLLRDGYPLRDRTIPVEVVAHTRSGNVYRAATNVYLQEGPRVSFALVVSGEETNYHPVGDEERFVLRITEHAGHEVPEGTKLTVKLPLSWEDPRIDEENLGWKDESLRETNSHHEMSAVIESGLTSAAIDFKFRAGKPAAIQDAALAIVVVELNDGVTGSGTILHRTLGETGTLAGPTLKGLHVAFGGRLDPGSSGPWSVVFANPGKGEAVFDPITGGCVLYCDTVTSVTITAGEEIFEESGLGVGWSRLDGRTLRWDGEAVVENDDAVEFRLDVRVVDRAKGGRFMIVPRVVFEDARNFAANLSFEQEDVLRGRVAAANETVLGYNREVGEHVVCSDVLVDGRLHRGCANYAVSSLPALALLSDKVATGLEGSTLELENGSLYLPGDWVTFLIDFAPVDANLTGSADYLGSDRTVVKVLHPWTKRLSSLADWMVAESWVIDSTEFTLTKSWQIPASASHGVYFVVVERYLDFRDGKEHDQVVRKLAWLQVGKERTEARTLFQELIVQAWLPDWG